MNSWLRQGTHVPASAAPHECFTRPEAQWYSHVAHDEAPALSAKVFIEKLLAIDMEKMPRHLELACKMFEPDGNVITIGKAAFKSSSVPGVLAFTQ